MKVKVASAFVVVALEGYPYIIGISWVSIYGVRVRWESILPPT